MDTSSNIPDGFVKIIRDFLNDILNTFPEYKDNLEDMLENILLPSPNENKVEKLFEYCTKHYPERFFDILYQNSEIFSNSEINTFFLPNIDFKKIWIEDISQKTRNIIWKYLQLILFSIVGYQTEGKGFGETAKFFEAIDENEFKNKLEETISQMGDMFENTDASKINVEDLPDPEKLHDHISSLLEGHLGCLAKEIAEETANEMNLDLQDVSSVGEVFKELFKNPGKLMKIVKKVGSKLDEKLKSGEIKESELLKEASDLMKKMGNTPGMKNMSNLFGKMGLPIGKNTKFNKNAFQAHMQKNMRQAAMRERMKEKMATRAKTKPKPIISTKKKKKVKKKVVESSWLPENYTQERTERTVRKKKKKRKNKNKK